MAIQSKVEEAAEELLRESGVEAAPVPVEDIARSLGTQLVFDSFDSDLSGILYRGKGAVIIGVNSTHSAKRQRFTIAHELGHLRLHEKQVMFVDKAVRVDRRDITASAGVDEREIDANGFGAALLMPRKMLISEIESLTDSPQSSLDAESLIELLAERFDVSQQAMKYRLANLGIAMLSE
jgi:Zn-dependent peptidase ImmA (M78 family)